MLLSLPVIMIFEAFYTLPLQHTTHRCIDIDEDFPWLAVRPSGTAGKVIPMKLSVYVADSWQIRWKAVRLKKSRQNQQAGGVK